MPPPALSSTHNSPNNQGTLSTAGPQPVLTNAQSAPAQGNSLNGQGSHPPSDAVALYHRQLVAHTQQMALTRADAATRQHNLQQRLDAQAGMQPKNRYQILDYNTEIQPLLQQGDTAALHRFMRKKKLAALSFIADNRVITFYLPRTAKGELWKMGSTVGALPGEPPVNDPHKAVMANDLSDLAAQLTQAEEKQAMQLARDTSQQTGGAPPQTLPGVPDPQPLPSTAQMQQQAPRRFRHNSPLGTSPTGKTALPLGRSQSSTL